MKKVGIFYGSTTGATEGVAETIAARLGVASEDIHNVELQKWTRSTSTMFCYWVVLHGESESCRMIGTISWIS